MLVCFIPGGGLSTEAWTGSVAEPSAEWCVEYRGAWWTVCPDGASAEPGPSRCRERQWLSCRGPRPVGRPSLDEFRCRYEHPWFDL